MAWDMGIYVQGAIWLNPVEVVQYDFTCSVIGLRLKSPSEADILQTGLTLFTLDLWCCDGMFQLRSSCQLFRISQHRDVALSLSTQLNLRNWGYSRNSKPMKAADPETLVVSVSPLRDFLEISTHQYLVGCDRQTIPDVM